MKTPLALRIIHFNTQDLANEDRLREFEYALKFTKYDIVGLSEIRREGERVVRRYNGNLWFYFGESKGFRGVGFYVNKRIVDRVIEFRGINERVAMLKPLKDRSCCTLYEHI